jgi:hypothetical protein
LFAFPDGSSGAEEIVPAGEAPFIGVNAPGDAYTDAYDAAHPDAPCAWIDDVWHYRCGVPDEAGGGGYFLDKIAVADVDADGVDDALLTFLWRSVVYPGAALGVPSYDTWYNPQDDGGYCHSGRHYGLSVLAQADADAPLETLDLAGLPVGAFSDIYQNVSRNVAVIDAAEGAGGVGRSLLWNEPHHTMIPYCGQPDLYEADVHVPGDGRIVDAGGITTHLLFDEWDQRTSPGPCADYDYACYQAQLLGQGGAWRIRAVDALTGATALSVEDAYAWDVLADGEDRWVVFSAAADTFNVGSESYDPPTGGDRRPPFDQVVQLRPDLSIGRLDLDAGGLTDVVTLPVDAAPLLLYREWQSTSGAHSSNSPAVALLAVPDPRGGPPAFAVRTASGIALVAREDGAWQIVAEYSPAGALPGDWGPVIDDGFDDGDLATNTGGVGGGFTEVSDYTDGVVEEVDGALTATDLRYWWAGARSLDRFDPVGVEVIVDIAGVDRDIVAEDGAPADARTRSVFGLVDEAASELYGAGGTGLYVEVGVDPGGSADVALVGASYERPLAATSFASWAGDRPLTLRLRTDADGWHLWSSEPFADGSMGRSGTWHGAGGYDLTAASSVALSIGHQFESVLRLDRVQVVDLGD